MPAAGGEPKTPSGKAPAWVKLLVVVLFVGVAAFFLVRAPTDAPPSQNDTAEGGAGPVDGGPLPAEPRCRIVPKDGAFRVGGDRSAPAVAPGSDGGAAADSGDGHRFSPFAAIVGRGVRFAGGYAVGVRQDTADGAFAQVAVVDESTGAGRLVDLGRSRGDVGAPLLAAAGDGLLVAALEPDASGFAIRMGRIAAGAVSWGDELPQGRDESLAYDVAVADESTVVAWDEATRDGERTQIVVAGLNTAEVRVEHPATPATSDERDAELPRLVRRGGGYWLVYVARRAVALPPNPSDDDLQRDPDQRRYAAEMIERSWLEVLPLELSGRSAGAARRITSGKGHIQAFDVERVSQDSVVVAWRDDDTPSGAQGGRVSVVVVGDGGIGETRLLAQEDVGSGVPNLLPGWVSVATRRGGVRLAPLDSEGLVQGALTAEPSLGSGQLIAAHGSSLLLAQPSGRAVDLTLAACQPRAVAAPKSADDGD